MNEDKKNDRMNRELQDEELDTVSGGVQAGIFTEGGHNEFGDTAKPNQPAETEEERRMRLIRQKEGKGYL